jgi:4'-phosphopantetheinyl transferase
LHRQSEVPPENEAHLWFAIPEDVPEQRLTALYEWLSPDERDRHARFRRFEDRRRYLVARALLRGVVSTYLGVHPGKLRFAQNEHGRPQLAAPPNPADLRFNVSKTSGLVACGVVRGRDIGVDVEAVDRQLDMLALAARFFSATELEDLRAHQAGGLDRRFFEYWTLKEAYLKARGTGLSLPLGQFSFHLGNTIRVSFEPAMEDDPRAWQLWQSELSPGHVAAVAIHRGAGPDLSILLRRWATEPL